MPFFNTLTEALGPCGLMAVDKLLGLKIESGLQNLFGMLDKSVFRNRSWIDLLENLGNSLNPVINIIGPNPGKFYQTFLGHSPRLLASIFDSISALGQLQLLRKQISHQISMKAAFDSKLLHSALRTFNKYSKRFAGTFLSFVYKLVIFSEL